MKENINRLALWYSSCSTPGTKFEKKKNKKNHQVVFLKNVILGPIFCGLCFIGYESFKVPVKRNFGLFYCLTWKTI